MKDFEVPEIEVLSLNLVDVASTSEDVTPWN